MPSAREKRERIRDFNCVENDLIRQLLNRNVKYRTDSVGPEPSSCV